MVDSRLLNVPAAVPVWLGPPVPGKGYEIQTGHLDCYQIARVRGDLPIEVFLSTLHVLGVESDGGEEIAMLVDLRSLTTEYTTKELVRVGQETASSFIHMKRVALLVLTRQVTRITERAARRSGMNMCVFDDEAVATGWVQATKS